MNILDVKYDGMIYNIYIAPNTNDITKDITTEITYGNISFDKNRWENILVFFKANYKNSKDITCELFQYRDLNYEIINDKHNYYKTESLYDTIYENMIIAVENRLKIAPTQFPILKKYHNTTINKKTVFETDNIEVNFISDDKYYINIIFKLCSKDQNKMNLSLNKILNDISTN